MTSLQDPARHHQLDFKANYYTQLERNTFDVDYSYLLYQNRDYTERPVQFYLNMGGNKAYVKKRSRPNSDQGTGIDQNHYLGLSGQYSRSSLRYQFFFQAERQKGNNFLYAEDFLRYQWVQTFSRRGILANSFWQKLELNYRPYYQKSRLKRNRARPFWGHIVDFEGVLSPWHRLTFDTRMSYGKNRKKGLRGGLLSAGGSQNFPFAFYGIGEDDAIGNEMAAFRLQASAEFFKIYRFYHTFPFYLKDINLLLGADYLKSDLIYLRRDGQFLRGKNLWGQHWGVRATATMFYVLPLEMDIIFNTLKNKYASDEKQTLFVLNTALSF